MTRVGQRTPLAEPPRLAEPPDPAELWDLRGLRERPEPEALAQRGFPLVLGVGNVLLRDEGVGVAVTAVMAGDTEGLPEGTRVVDGGTLGLDLLPLIGDAGSMVLVDAVDLGRPPGTIAVLRDDEIHGALAGHVSPHQVGIGDLIAAARLMGTLPERVALIGIQPGIISIGLELTDAVAAAVPRAIALARDEISRSSAPAVA